MTSAAAARWVGEWWADALRHLGPRGLEVHADSAEPGRLGRLVCFAGVGPGEVLHEGRKVVGVSQWRSRQGALFSTCAYLRWDPVPLSELLEPSDPRRHLERDLRPVALGLAELRPAARELAVVRDRLLASLPGLSTP